MRHWQFQQYSQRLLYDRQRARERSRPKTPAEPILRPATPRRRESNPQILRFTPYAWAKLLWFRDRGPTEIGGFGISAADDLLLVKDFVTVAQRVSPVSVAFEDDAVADHFDTQAAAGRPPERTGRIWLHTHPGDCPQPSGVDEETFERVFGRCHWAVMFILARGGDTYARLRFGVGPSAQMQIPVTVDYGQTFGASALDAWEGEYQAHVRRVAAMSQMPTDLDLLDEIAWTELERVHDAEKGPDVEGFIDKTSVCDAEGGAG